MMREAAEYNAELNVSLTFLNDRTELTLTVADRETAMRMLNDLDKMSNGAEI